jgi:hypothetical protein
LPTAAWIRIAQPPFRYKIEMAQSDLFAMTNNPAGPVAIPAIIISGSPIEVDRYLVVTLWTGEEPKPSVRTVTEWVNILHERGDDFASHASACHYWLFEQMANKAGKPLTRPYPPT